MGIRPPQTGNGFLSKNGSPCFAFACKVFGSGYAGSMPGPSEITDLLKRWSAGDESARDQLIPLIYDRLHEMAHHQLRRAPGERSLNTTGLVHETYLRFAEVSDFDFPDRARFLALASQVMRNLLVDRARARMAAKRGGGDTAVALEEWMTLPDQSLEHVLELHEALARLETLSPRQGALLQHRYFGGLSLEESASAVGISLATAKRELRSARAWLAVELH
jgi:RNA polymerase sigma factor (TIGR02999 family)